jgi:hypothetical protein
MRDFPNHTSPSATQRDSSAIIGLDRAVRRIAVLFCPYDLRVFGVATFELRSMFDYSPHQGGILPAGTPLADSPFLRVVLQKREREL